jgi:NAD(P)-dependent dehydrogenase (short-subunit alcohol dehydrogenase family)
MSHPSQPSSIRLDGRVAIVTGAGAGLGRSHALQLAARGAQVVVNDLGDTKAVVDEIIAAGGQAIGFSGSVTDADAMTRMVEQTMAQWGRIDILVNNAGILRDKSFSKMTLDDFRLVVDVHLMGAVICTKAVWEIMKTQQYGRIIFTTSSSGLFGNFGQSNYGAAKMALVGLMQTLSLEGEKANIRVNCLAPTAATQMTEGILTAEVLAQFQPERVSPGLVMLASEQAPTRAILCAGAGTFASAHITLTEGLYVGPRDDAADVLAQQFDQVTDRHGEVVPPYGMLQSQRELSNATQRKV